MSAKLNPYAFLFKDKQLGDYGFFIWVAPIASIVFFIIYIYCFIVSISETFSGLQEYLVLILGNVVFASMTLWFLYETKTALSIIQEIELLNNDINVVFYFRKKLNINISDIASVSLLDKNSFLLKKHRAVQTDKPCLEIKTKDSQSYLITPHMERFDELKVALDKLVKEHN